MKLREITLLAGLAFTFAACARQQTETDTGEVEPSADAQQTEAQQTDTQQTDAQNEPSNASDSAKANQTKMGVTNTETGQGTLGEDVVETNPTDEAEGGTQTADTAAAAGATQDTAAAAGATQTDTTTQTTSEKPPK